MSRSSFRKWRTKGIPDTAPRAKARVGIKQCDFFRDDKNVAVARDMGPVEG